MTYPGLDKNVNLKIRHELMDQDYIHKLSPEEKDWLSRFNEEYNGNNFKHKGDILHTTKELKKDCERKNNSHNRDASSTAGVKKKLINVQIKSNSQNINKDSNNLLFENNKTTNPNEREDLLNKIIDCNNRTKRRAAMPQK